MIKQQFKCIVYKIFIGTPNNAAIKNNLKYDLKIVTNLYIIF